MAAKKAVADVTPAPYVTIYESEFQVIAGESALKDGIETGGDLFGAQTRAGRPLIYLATGPGPKAVHGVTRFTQDIDVFRDVSQVVEESTGLQWRGTWHSHHELRLPEPSAGDTRKVIDLTRKNDLHQWLEIIVTYERTRYGLFTSRRYRRSGMDDQGPTQIRAGAFVYTDPQDGVKVAAPIRVLPGISPFRLALLATGRLNRRALGEHAVCFPMEQIVYEALNTPASGQASDIPETLIAQIKELPEETQGKLGLCMNEDVLVVTFELPDGRAADVALSTAAPHVVKAVRLRAPLAGTSSDLTKEIADQKLERLSAIHKTLAGRRSCGLLGRSVPDRSASAGTSDDAALLGGTKCDLLQ